MNENPFHNLIDGTDTTFTNLIWGDRDDIEEGNPGPMLDSLKALLTRDNMTRYRQRVRIHVRGYDNDPRELYSIPEVRHWMSQINAQWPYWFFFCEPGETSSLRWIVLCLSEVIPIPNGVRAGDGFIQFIENSLGAMNYICDFLGDDDDVNIEMSQSIYATYGMEEST